MPPLIGRVGLPLSLYNSLIILALAFCRFVAPVSAPAFCPSTTPHTIKPETPGNSPATSDGDAVSPSFNKEPVVVPSGGNPNTKGFYHDKVQ